MVLATLPIVTTMQSKQSRKRQLEVKIYIGDVLNNPNPNPDIRSHEHLQMYITYN
jgi:hypothetical protein